MDELRLVGFGGICAKPGKLSSTTTANRRTFLDLMNLLLTHSYEVTKPALGLPACHDTKIAHNQMLKVCAALTFMHQNNDEVSGFPFAEPNVTPPLFIAACGQAQ